MAREVGQQKPAIPVRPRSPPSKVEVIVRSVAAVPVEDEAVEQVENQSQEDETVRPAESADEAGADEPGEDFGCEECVVPRVLPDPGQPTQNSWTITEWTTYRLGRGAQNALPAEPPENNTLQGQTRNRSIHFPWITCTAPSRG